MRLFLDVVTSQSEKKLRESVGRAALVAFSNVPKAQAKKLLKDRIWPYQLEIVLVSAKKIQALNAKYRKIKKPTDVLSFAGTPKTPSIGELVICWPVVKKQAKEFKVPPLQELDRMVIHGLLHLFGYEHENTPAKSKKMFALQEKILEMLWPGKVRPGQRFK